VSIQELADADDFGRFMRAEYQSTLRHVTPLVGTLAEDVVQEAFVVAYRNWAHVSRLGAPYAWVRLVARRMAMRERTRAAARPGREAVAGDRPASVFAVEDSIDLERAVRSLPPNHRAAVRLYYHADMPVSAIAATLGASEPAVKVWLHRARAALADTLLMYRGEWTTPDPWTVEDLDRAVHTRRHAGVRAVVLDEVPVGDGRWILQFTGTRYRIETDAGLTLDRGRARASRDGLELTPWNESGTVRIGAEIDGDRARFTVGRDTTAPTRGIADSVFLGLILETRAFARHETRSGSPPRV
jgi:RNA polymerase sigma-70 factor, ECF subfamily